MFLEREKAAEFLWFFERDIELRDKFVVQVIITFSTVFLSFLREISRKENYLERYEPT
jgi:hypothetical protein